MERNKKLITNSKTSNMLNELVDDLDCFFTFGFQPAKVMKYGMSGVRAARDSRDRADRKKTLTRLETMKMIKIEQIGDRYLVALTEKGAIELLRQKVMDADVIADGSKCLVVFDVPEVKREVRRMLRKFLKEAYFFQKQKSVWIAPFRAGEALVELFKANGAIGWVSIYYAYEIE